MSAPTEWDADVRYARVVRYVSEGVGSVHGDLGSPLKHVGCVVTVHEETTAPMGVAAFAPDAVLIDVPDHRRGVIAALCRVQGLVPNVPFVALLHGDSQRLGLHALQAGACDYISLDMDTPAMVAQTVDCAIARGRLCKALAQAAARQGATTVPLLRSIDGVGDGILVLDMNGFVRLLNQAGADVLTRERFVVLGQLLRAWLVPGGVDEIRFAAGTDGSAAQPPALRVTPMRWGDESAYWVRLCGVHGTWHADALLREFQDMLNRRNAERVGAMRRRQRVGGVLAGWMRHAPSPQSQAVPA